jgi:hypothetical protein
MTAKEYRDEAIKLFGNEKIADKALGSLMIGSTDEYMRKQLLRKYRNECINYITDDQAVSIKQLADNIYQISDYIEHTETICIISDDGKIEFFDKINEFSNLTDYIDEFDNLDDYIKKIEEEE